MISDYCQQSKLNLSFRLKENLVLSNILTIEIWGHKRASSSRHSHNNSIDNNSLIQQISDKWKGSRCFLMLSVGLNELNENEGINSTMVVTNVIKPNVDESLPDECRKMYSNVIDDTCTMDAAFNLKHKFIKYDKSIGEVAYVDLFGSLGVNRDTPKAVKVKIDVNKKTHAFSSSLADETPSDRSWEEQGDLSMNAVKRIRRKIHRYPSVIDLSNRHTKNR
ncbi:hypothetical protein GJ496_001124 [Pomphorhynchus laevis]|nr:hypothetical protein GJ496_001124 [Pomphorhynchus laevis]